MINMFKAPKLTPNQWKLLSSAFSNIGQAIILFSLAAVFVPETINLSKEYSKLFGICYLIAGWIVLTIGVIILNRGK